MFLLNIILLTIGLVPDPPASQLETAMTICPILVDYGSNPIHPGMIVNLTPGPRPADRRRR